MKTPTRSQIPRLIAEGKTNKEIGALLGVSEKTVKAHCTSIFKDYNVVNRTQLAVKFHEIQRVVVQHINSGVIPDDSASSAQPE